MRLIFLSWAYPPMDYPRAIQVERLARNLGRRGIEIFCASRTGDAIERGDIVVHRLAEARPSPLLQKLGVARVRAALAAPDSHRAWAARAADVIAQTPLAPEDVLVTFGQPMSDHLAGLALAARFGRRWIAHFSDPWADNPYATAPFHRRRNLGPERAVIARADHVLLTSEETLDLVMAKYPPAWRAKASVLPHAFEASLYPPRQPARGPVVVRYLGSLYGARSPLPVLRALAILARQQPDLVRRLVVEFIGEIAPRLVAAAEHVALPPGLVRFVPSVPYRDALALMRGADLLLHIDAPATTSVFLASKLIDYIGARRPILAVTPAGTAAGIVAALGGWVADPGAPERIAAHLADAVAAIERDRDADWGDETVRQRYDIGTVARDFAALVERVGGPSAAPSVAPAGERVA